MKANNTTTDHNRTIRITDIPQYHESDPVEMLITIKYVDDDKTSRGAKAVVLDSIVIPRLIKAINDAHNAFVEQCGELPRL